MVSECEHRYLVKLARDARHRGLDQQEAAAAIEAEVGGFSSRFRITRAVARAFDAVPAPIS